MAIYRLSGWEGYIPKEASTLLHDGVMYQHKTLDLASVNPEPLLIAATDERNFKHKFMFLGEASTITLSLIYFTSSGQELLFLIALTVHLQRMKSLSGEMLLATLLCLCFLSLLWKRGFLCSLILLRCKEV